MLSNSCASVLIYIVFAYYIPKDPYFKDILKKENKYINATVAFTLVPRALLTEAVFG